MAQAARCQSGQCVTGRSGLFSTTLAVSQGSGSRCTLGREVGILAHRSRHLVKAVWCQSGQCVTGRSGLLSTNLAVFHGSGSRYTLGYSKCVLSRCGDVSFRCRVASVVAPFRPVQVLRVRGPRWSRGPPVPGPAPGPRRLFCGSSSWLGGGGELDGPHRDHHDHDEINGDHDGHYGPHCSSPGPGSRWTLSR